MVPMVTRTLERHRLPTVLFGFAVGGGFGAALAHRVR